jgi:ATP-dependent DNA helicase RecG
LKEKDFLKTPIEYLKGVGPVKAASLGKELGIFTFEDLLTHFPFRYIDKTHFHRIADLSEDSDNVQLHGLLRRLETLGDGPKKRLVGRLRDASGHIELVWFKSVAILQKTLKINEEYIVYGKVNYFNGSLNIVHPEMEGVSDANAQDAASLAPVYPSTEPLSRKGLDAKGLRRLTKTLLQLLQQEVIPETLPIYLQDRYRLLPRKAALMAIHFPKDEQELQAARNRLKFEELFFVQLRLLQLKLGRQRSIKGHVFATIGEHFNNFYKDKLPFELTNAQKRVLKEIRRDMAVGQQMNRLLQGDVGSGKTMVAVLSMLMALDNGFQACLMAPTEILAQQHYNAISEYLEDTGIVVGFLTGNVKGKQRKALLQSLANGQTHIIIGTHALLEDKVVFQKLGLAITDEQHRFGVEQRAKLWAKSSPCPPHILVMTATPIPRTLAMTLYGDLDISIIDELPPGRKPIQTLHKTESGRLRVFGFMREEIAKGRQVYVVYPLIEESETLDLLNLEQGYANLSKEFPMPRYQISVVHGKMKPADKEFEMQRFVRGETQIMVATTVIEVGVNVPNASVMIIENTERFGLSQLHQLRGRVGRGADQSYCILMSGYKLTSDARERIQTMCQTNDGFKIAEVDLRLRGPGNIEGTQQSGVLSFRIAELAKDGRILQVARQSASEILDADPELMLPENTPLRLFMLEYAKKTKGWAKIS